MLNLAENNETKTTEQQDMQFIESLIQEQKASIRYGIFLLALLNESAANNHQRDKIH